MNKKIDISKEQLESLVPLSGIFTGSDDIIIAREIYNAAFNASESNDTEFSHFSSLGVVLRIGYIMGVRAERTHRRKKRGE